MQFAGTRLAKERRSGSVVGTPVAAIGFAAFLLTAVAALALLMIWQSYSASMRVAEARAESSSQIVAAHLEWMLEASDQTLRRIDSAFGRDPIRVSVGAIADIREAVGDLPDGFQYSVYDEVGQLRLSSVPEAIGIDVSDREYFKRLVAGESTVISQQLEERLSGEQVFVIARRISRDGDFHGAASIAIPTRTMDDFWSNIQLGPNSTVAALRNDGWLVARHPQLDLPMNFSETMLFTDLLAQQPGGFYHSSSSLADGRSRIIGYQKVKNWPLVATIGIERGEALQEFKASLLAGLAVGIPTIIIMILGTMWISRLLRKDVLQRLHLEQALERNAFLFREIHHRVKNNLQAVASLLRLQPLPEEVKANMTRRVSAMVAVHEQIYESDQFEELELSSYIRRLVTQIASSFPAKVEIDFQLEEMRVDRDNGLPIGLIVNELVSNAYKYAFSDGTGHLVVRLSTDGETGRLLIGDNGPGYSAQDANDAAAGEEGRKGMGSRLIAGFVAQIQGTFERDSSDGTTVIITFPLSAADNGEPV